MNNRNETPFIHLFSTPLGYYFYDVNTGQIIKVDKQIYQHLNGEEVELNSNDLKIINLLNEKGFLKSNRVKKIEHPCSKVLPFLLENKVGSIILQVTQNCNLNCEYCIYSGNYNTRTHSKKKMSLDIAKKAIDFLMAHSKNTNIVYIGFYGGEPLLEFKLIKECVNYANNIGEGKIINYSMTTNGTLLNDEVIDFLIQHNFRLTISLDGPKELHNRSRRFAGTGIGSYDVLIKNVEKIKHKSEEYYNKKVIFNTVLLTKDSFSCVDTYFKGEELFKDSYFSASIVSDAFVKEEREVADIFVCEQQYELFKAYLWKMGRLNEKYVSVLLRGDLNQLNLFVKRMRDDKRVQLPEKWHRGGPCIPGINRLFVTVEGELLPCEKVCEIAEISKLGDVEKGFDIKKAKYLLNIEKITEEKCRNCWAYVECTSCIRVCDDKQENISEKFCQECQKIKNNLEDLLKDYTVLSELGCDFQKRFISKKESV